MTENEYRCWRQHFAEEPRSTAMVQVPKDIFDFLLLVNEAYGSMDGGEIPVVVAAQMLCLDLLREISPR